MSTLLRMKGVLTDGVPAQQDLPGQTETYTVTLETYITPVEGAWMWDGSIQSLWPSLAMSVQGQKES